MDPSTTTTHPPATANGESDLIPLEQEVLDEYSKLVGNLDNVCSPPFPQEYVSNLIPLTTQTAFKYSSRTSSKPLSTDSRRAARSRAQDGDGVYVAEGECV